MSLHMLPPLPSSLLLLLKSPFCRTATSSVSTRCSSRRRCTAQAALHLERRVHANYDGGGGRTRLAYASSSSSSSSSPSSSSLPSWNAVPSTSRSISTSLPSRKSTEDPTSPNSLTTPAQDPNEPRLRAHHELYQISSKKRRLVLYNDKTAKKLVDAMDLGKKKDLVVLDLYAG